MMQIDTEFRKIARKLRSPLRADFNPNEWVDALKELEKKTEDDLRLLAAALWLASESEALRVQLPIPDVISAGGRLSTILAIAMLNREFSNLAERHEGAVRRAVRGGAIAFDHIAGLPLNIRETGQSISVSDYMDAATDSVGSWLWDAAQASISGSRPNDLLTAGARALRRYSLQNGLHDIWQQVLWEGWHLQAEKGGELSWQSADRRLKKLFDAWHAREQANFMNYAWIDAVAWPKMNVERRRELNLKRTVTQVAGGKNPKRFEIGRPACGQKSISQYVIEKAGLEGSYLAPFLEHALPAHETLTCALLLKAWHILGDLAELLSRSLPNPSLRNVAEVRRWALEIHRKDLIDVLMRALALDATLAEAILVFFTWTPATYKGLWGSPIVQIPGAQTACLARSIFGTSNPIRRVEIWLQKGGFDDNNPRLARGSLYEAALRREIAARIAQNELFDDVRCAPNSIKKTADFPEQVDLLVQLGSLLLVGEIKCLLFPADPHERFNYFQKLAGASKQARSKAKALEGRPDVVARALAISEEHVNRLRVIPLVVTNQGFGMSSDIDGCRVVDARFLKLYLASGDYVGDASLNFGQGKTAFANRTLYSSQAEAVSSFERIMADPPTLRRFIDRLEWTQTPFPTSTGASIMLEGTVLKDISDDERGLAHTLQALTRAS